MGANRRATLSIALLVALSLRGAAGAEEPIRVRYRSADTVYLDAGQLRGLEVGGRLSVTRGGLSIAELEVSFVAEHSSSCRVLVEFDSINPGDLATPLLSSTGSQRVRPTQPSAPLVVLERTGARITVDGGESVGLSVGDLLDVLRGGRPIGKLRIVSVSAFAAAGTIVSESESILIGDGAALERAVSSRLAEPAPAELSRPASPTTALETSHAPSSGKPSALALTVDPVVPLQWQPQGRPEPPPETTVTGTLNLGWEMFQEPSPLESSENRRSDARLSLRARHLGGRPYEFRVRLGLEQNDTGRFGADTASFDRNRLYELSLRYDPPQGRFAYRLGRLPSNAFTGVGYLDGLLGQMALSSSIEVGGFVGSDARTPELDLAGQRHKLGVFARFTSPTTDSALPWEIVAAAIQENGEADVSRQYATLQARYDRGKRWSLFQRAEVDINTGWRKELTQSTVQLSNLSLAATGRLTKSVRLGLSYSLFEQVRTEETRALPETLFNDLQRQGFRATLQWGKPRGLNFSLSGGLRNQEGEPGSTVSYGLAVRHPRVSERLGIGLTLNALGFSNDTTEGYLLSLRTSKRLPGGHQLGAVLGTRHSAISAFDGTPESETHWLRLSGWFELPQSLFATLGVETTGGDELRGTRVRLGIGYRF